MDITHNPMTQPPAMLPKTTVDLDCGKYILRTLTPDDAADTERMIHAYLS